MKDKSLSWVEQIADRLVGSHRGDSPIVCASGVSPSGHIHLGNLREMMITHFVAEELSNRGVAAQHLHFWDDFDPLRKVPAGMPETLRPHIGRPLNKVPDVCGDHESYAAHQIAEFEDGTVSLKLGMTPVLQSDGYASGAFSPLVRTAMEQRARIYEVMQQVKTGEKVGTDGVRPEDYYPFKPYCEVDDYATTVTGYDEDTAVVTYNCGHCGFDGEMVIDDGPLHGKLAWKVDWPMRWAQVGIDFEPGGADHSAPGGSFDVAKSLVREVFGKKAPLYSGYSFVGVAGGSSKMSSSKGFVLTPALALQVLEPAMLRWMYGRRQPRQSMSIDLGAEAIIGLYEGWDRFSSDTVARGGNKLYSVSTRTAVGEIEQPAVKVPFRLLSSVLDITQGDDRQMRRLVNEALAGSGTKVEGLALLEPRVSNARRFVAQLPDAERTVVRTTPDRSAAHSLQPDVVQGLQVLVARVQRDMTLDEWSHTLYSIPKVVLGLEPDAKPTPEIKAAQREFFRSLYVLTTGKETGPRLPTLFASIGATRVQSLIGPVAALAVPRAGRAPGTSDIGLTP